MGLGMGVGGDVELAQGPLTWSLGIPVSRGWAGVGGVGAWVCVWRVLTWSLGSPVSRKGLVALKEKPPIAS